MTKSQNRIAYKGFTIHTQPGSRGRAPTAVVVMPDGISTAAGVWTARRLANAIQGAKRQIDSIVANEERLGSDLSLTSHSLDLTDDTLNITYDDANVTEQDVDISLTQLGAKAKPKIKVVLRGVSARPPKDWVLLYRARVASTSKKDAKARGLRKALRMKGIRALSRKTGKAVPVRLQLYTSKKDGYWRIGIYVSAVTYLAMRKAAGLPVPKESEWTSIKSRAAQADPESPLWTEAPDGGMPVARDGGAEVEALLKEGAEDGAEAMWTEEGEAEGSMSEAEMQQIESEAMPPGMDEAGGAFDTPADEMGLRPRPLLVQNLGPDRDRTHLFHLTGGGAWPREALANKILRTLTSHSIYARTTPGDRETWITTHDAPEVARIVAATAKKARVAVHGFGEAFDTPADEMGARAPNLTPKQAKPYLQGFSGVRNGKVRFYLIAPNINEAKRFAAAANKVRKHKLAGPLKAKLVGYIPAPPILPFGIPNPSPIPFLPMPAWIVYAPAAKVRQPPDAVYTEKVVWRDAPVQEAAPVDSDIEEAMEEMDEGDETGSAFDTPADEMGRKKAKAKGKAKKVRAFVAEIDGQRIGIFRTKAAADAAIANVGKILTAKGCGAGAGSGSSGEEEVEAEEMGARTPSFYVYHAYAEVPLKPGGSMVTSKHIGSTQSFEAAVQLLNAPASGWIQEKKQRGSRFYTFRRPGHYGYIYGE